MFLCYNSIRTKYYFAVWFRFGGSGGSSVQIRRNHHYRNWSFGFISRNTHQAQMRRYVWVQAYTHVFGYEKRSRFRRVLGVDALYL